MLDKTLTIEVLIVVAIGGWIYLASANSSKKNDYVVANMHSFHDCVVEEITDNKMEASDAEDLCRSVIYKDETPEYSRY